MTEFLRTPSLTYIYWASNLTSAQNLLSVKSLINLQAFYLNHSSESDNLSIVEFVDRNVVQRRNRGPLVARNFSLKKLGNRIDQRLDLLRNCQLPISGSGSGFQDRVLLLEDLIHEVQGGSLPVENSRHFETRLMNWTFVKIENLNYITFSIFSQPNFTTSSFDSLVQNANQNLFCFCFVMLFVVKLKPRFCTRVFLPFKVKICQMTRIQSYQNLDCVISY